CDSCRRGRYQRLLRPTARSHFQFSEHTWFCVVANDSSRHFQRHYQASARLYRFWSRCEESTDDCGAVVPYVPATKTGRQRQTNREFSRQPSRIADQLQLEYLV